MKRIIFFQPALPEYRVDFFKELINLTKGTYKLEVHSAQQDFLGVRSKKTEFSTSRGYFKKFGPFYWQTSLPKLSFELDDIVVVTGNPRIINYMVILAYCKIKRIKVIWWGQGWTAGSRSFFSSLRRKLMLVADGIAVYTEKEASELEHKNLVGLNNGLKLSHDIFLGDKMVRSDNASLNLLFIGRLTEKANVRFLFRALAQCKSEYNLSIIGDGPEKSTLNALASELGIDDKITWYGEVTTEAEIASVAKHCDYFIYPGSVGLSLIHAFNLFLPAIVHNKTALQMPEYAAFSNAYNGFSFEYGNIDSLASLVDRLEFIGIGEMRLNARKTVELTFNTGDMAKRFYSIIEKL
ncbi:glycosyltransferase [Vibrio owensii]|uniref:glycosyltransferase n=1 Tax=Vibrio owensii TaxID=696485 RepID=UPI0018F1AEB6|nr:glycosyltransferase [Vibrio owensii]